MFEQVKLSFEMNALEPYVDQLTMETHYGKHHVAYSKMFNALAEKAGVADESAEAVVEEPQVDESVSQETEDDVPTIEVHSADEKDNDLFASKQEGSQTSFFG
jgi:superoxide dismutase